MLHSNRCRTKSGRTRKLHKPLHMRGAAINSIMSVLYFWKCKHRYQAISIQAQMHEGVVLLRNFSSPVSTQSGTCAFTGGNGELLLMPVKIMGPAPLRIMKRARIIHVWAFCAACGHRWVAIPVILGVAPARDLNCRRSQFLHLHRISSGRTPAQMFLSS